MVDLPMNVREYYKEFCESTRNTTTVYKCGSCGFLTQSSRVGDYKGYRCNNCGKELSSRTRYEIIYDRNTGSKEDVTNITLEQVPNSERHLKQIKSNLDHGLTMNEFISKVEEEAAKYEQFFDTTIAQNAKAESLV